VGSPKVGSLDVGSLDVGSLDVASLDVASLASLQARSSREGPTPPLGEITP